MSAQKETRDFDIECPEQPRGNWGDTDFEGNKRTALGENKKAENSESAVESFITQR